jgi:hypothetical protein
MYLYLDPTPIRFLSESNRGQKLTHANRQYTTYDAVVGGSKAYGKVYLLYLHEKVACSIMTDIFRLE